jgi:hypothetical protein
MMMMMMMIRTTATMPTTRPIAAAPLLLLLPLLVFLAMMMIAFLRPPPPPPPQPQFHATTVVRRSSSRRVLLQKVETLNVMDDETKLRHMKNFIGGLYPPVDKDTLPLYLRDSLDAGTELSRPLDLVYFWHIPKVGAFVPFVRSFHSLPSRVVVSFPFLRFVSAQILFWWFAKIKSNPPTHS